MPKRPFVYQRSAEDSAKAAQRRARHERRESARPAVNMLRTNNPLGVVALKGASIDYFMDGLRDGHGKDRVLDLDAFGILQGTPLGDRSASLTRRLMSQHQKLYKSGGILAFMGFNFKEIEHTTIPPIGERIQELLKRQNSRDSRFRRKYPSVLIVGDGDLGDLTSHPALDAAQHPIARLVTRWALDKNNTLITPSPEIELPGLPGLEETPGIEGFGPDYST